MKTVLIGTEESLKTFHNTSIGSIYQAAVVAPETQADD